MTLAHTDTHLAVAAIRMDGGTQARDMNSPGVVEEYAEAMREGAAFPPVIVVFDGSDYWLADGFHRVLAAQVAGLPTLEADIRQGTRRDAVLLACGANSAHGMQRTNRDKRRAVETLLRDEEWAQWSDGEIARRCGVSQPFVSGMRKELSPNRYEIAAVKRVERGGTTYEMHTGAIGQRGPALREEMPLPSPVPRRLMMPAGGDTALPPVLVTVRATAEGFADAARRYLSGAERAELRELL